MKKIILLIFLGFFCLTARADFVPEASHQVVPTKKIAVIYSYSLESFEFSHLDNVFLEIREDSPDTKYVSKRYFLDVKTNESNTLIKERSLKLWKKAVDFNADYYVIIGNEAYDALRSEILASKNLRIGIFDVYMTESQIRELVQSKPTFYVSYYNITTSYFSNYSSANGISINHYYVIRDSSQKWLQATEEIKQELVPTHQAEVHEYVIYTIQDLRAILVNLQLKEKGIIVPLLTNLYDADEKSYVGLEAIVKTILEYNIHQIELFVTAEVSSRGISFSNFHEHKACTDDPRGTRNYIDEFLNGEVGTSEETPFIYANSKRISQLGVSKFLQNLSQIRCLWGER